MAEILALGDCNTLGVQENRYNTYAEKVAALLGKSVKNCGYTMSTSREMQYFFQDFYTKKTEIILCQYGLVDSWKTFKYAPYVLYYPDNGIRKILRKIVKKYKKTAKQIGLNSLLGVENVVPLEEYTQNIRNMIESAQKSDVFLIDTVPNMDTSRNDEIQRYNSVLQTLAQEYEHVIYVAIYDCFLNRAEYYLDATHLNAKGYELISKKILDLYRK
jgi:lysophospholipase L1-like esterase